MRLLVIIIALAWVAFWSYWIVSAAKSEPSTMPPNLRRFVFGRVGTIFLAFVLALLFHRLPQSVQRHLAGSSPGVLAAGFLLFLMGIVVAVWARIYLGKNWGMPMTQKQDPELVTSGPYRYIRHPIYTGLLLMMLGSALDANTYWLLVFVVAAAYFIYSALAEEKLMMQQFPKVYPQYKRRTKMLIPFLL